MNGALWRSENWAQGHQALSEFCSRVAGPLLRALTSNRSVAAPHLPQEDTLTCQRRAEWEMTFSQHLASFSSTQKFVFKEV